MNPSYSTVHLAKIKHLIYLALPHLKQLTPHVACILHSKLKPSMDINKDIAIMAESSVYCSLVNTDPCIAVRKSEINGTSCITA